MARPEGLEPPTGGLEIRGIGFIYSLFLVDCAFSVRIIDVFGARKRTKRKTREDTMTKRFRRGYLYRRGNMWWVQYSIDGQVIRESLGTTDRREAEQLRAERLKPILAAEKADALAAIVHQLGEAKSERDQALNEAAVDMTLSAAWSAYEKATNRPDAGRATLDIYAMQWGCFTRWMGETHPDVKTMRDVTAERAEGYAEHLTGRGVTANTYNKHIWLCGLVFRILADKARIQANPFEGITRKRQPPQSRRELSLDELRNVCQQAEGELRLLLALGLYLGARLGDAATMRWDNVNMRKGFVKYTPSKTASRSGKTLTVPMHPDLFAVLSETPPPERKGFIAPDLAERYTERGPYAVADIVQAHFEKCGIATTRAGRGVRRVVDAGFHSLRHSAVSLLREAGAPLSVTMAIVGHSSVAMHDTYTHTGEAAIKAAVSALPSILSDAKPVAALPAGKMIEAAKVMALADMMNGKTWRKVRDQMKALCA